MLPNMNKGYKLRPQALRKGGGGEEKRPRLIKSESLGTRLKGYVTSVLKK